MRPTTSQRALFAAIAALALALRLPLLGSTPNPSGDEGNWALLALGLSRGADASLGADAGFVSSAFAWMIAGSFKLLGPSFFAARLVPALGLVALLALAWRLCIRLGAPRAGLCLAALLATHPWSVFWSRTASVPYALSLGLAVCATLATLDAARSRSMSAWVAAAQLHGLGLHFSPLALVTAAGSTLALALDHRDALRSRSPWIAAVTAIPHLAVVLPGVASVPVAARQDVTAPLAERAISCLRMMLAHLDGHSTLRHLSSTPRLAEIAGAVAVLPALVVVVASARRASAENATTRAGLAGLATALIGLPLALLPARAWHMPTIDADRYGFVLLAPFFVALASLAESPRPRDRRATGLATLTLAGAPGLLLALALLRGTLPDHGATVAEGGSAYRGWQPIAERRPAVDEIYDAVRRDAGSAPAVVLYDDYAFHPLRFVIAARRDGAMLHRLASVEVPAGRRAYAIVWSDGVFADDTGGGSWLARSHAAWRRAVFASRPGARRLRRWTLPDGRPLFELWGL